MTPPAACAEIRTSTASWRAYVATIGLVARSSGSPSRSATSDSPMPVRRSVRTTLSRPTPLAASRGWTSFAHIGRISRGGPGSVTITRAIGPVDPPAGRGAVGVREHRARRQHPGLLEVGLRERLAAARPQSAQPLERRLIHDRLLAAGLRDRLAGQVVRRRTEATRGDDDVGTAECGAQRVHDRGEVVGEVRDADDPDAQAHERAGQLAAVGVGRLADRQLGPDREQLRRDDRPAGVRRRLERGCIGHGASVLDGDATGRCYDRPRSPERLPTPAEDDRWIPNGPPLTTRGRPPRPRPA